MKEKQEHCNNSQDIGLNDEQNESSVLNGGPSNVVYRCIGFDMKKKKKENRKPKKGLYSQSEKEETKEMGEKIRDSYVRRETKRRKKKMKMKSGKSRECEGYNGK